MSRDQIESKLRDLFFTGFGIERGNVLDTTHILNDLDLNSLDFLELRMIVEEAFGFVIPDDDGDKLVIFRDLVSYVEDHIP